MRRTLENWKEPMKRTGLKTFLLASAVSALSLSAAQAVEALDAAERLKGILAEQQTQLTYESADVDGDDVVLRGAKLSFEESDDPVELGDVLLEDVSEDADGAYRIGRLYVERAVQETDVTTVEMEEFEMLGLILPKDSDSDPFAGVTRYDAVNIATIEADLYDQDLLLVENVTTRVTVDADGAFRNVTEVESFNINLMALDDKDDDEEFVDMLQEIDYDDITGSMQMTGLWNPSDGRLALTKFEIAMEEVGALNLTTDLSGYTPDFIRSLRAIVAESDGDTQGSDMGMAALGLMQQLMFHGLSIRFDDGSVTGRLLNHIADEQGVEPGVLIQAVRETVENQLAPFTGNDFAKSAAKAVGDFLDNPRNIELAAKPATPVPFMMFAAAMAAPEMLIKQLGLTITANQ